MMMRAMWLPVVLGLGACGISEDKFQEEYVGSTCELMMECPDESATGVSFGFDSAADCEAFIGAFFALSVGGCDYDAKAAKDCLASFDSMTCDASADTDAAVCAEVYSGECDWFSTSTSGPSTSMSTIQTPTSTSTTQTGE
jgi:hypothetical protein